ncbi:MAG: toxic anion resistance protein, partial [Chloroflexota bacterium]
MEGIELAPPEGLEAPKPVKPVEKEQAEGLMKLDNQTLTNLENRAEKFVDEVMAAKVNSDQFMTKVNAIHNLGNKEIRESANVSNRLLNKPTRSLEQGIFDESSEISRGLVSLRTTVEDLDPSTQGDLFSPKRLFGIIPMGDKVRNYFLKYQSSQKHINAILNSLQQGQDELRKDNAAVEEEKINLWKMMEKLQQYIYMSRQIDASLEARVAQLQQTDPEKARIVQEEMLFYVRQKVQDLLTQLAVSIQGYLALDMVRKNNLELIKGVDRATTTTISALRTAVITAQALTNQKLVLDQINALNTTTSNLIESTSAMLKRQTAQVHKQASESTVDMTKLKVAFDNIYATMDNISDYKIQALGTMQETVNYLADEVTRAQTYMDRTRQNVVEEATADLELGPPPGDGT